jgi:dTDP-4-dehydrorhamnose 3,5-epimerase
VGTQVKITATAISDVLVIEPQVFGDARGFFFESFNAREFERQTGLNVSFVQDNHSRSGKNVLRGLHYQILQSQGKLVRVVAGEIFDVAVDIRERSPTFGKWTAKNLSAENKKQMWIPAGFAHGFMVLSEYAEVLYKTTDYYAPEQERCIKWDDPDIAVQWPIGNEKPLTSSKDAQGVPLKNAEVFC